MAEAPRSRAYLTLSACLPSLLLCYCCVACCLCMLPLHDICACCLCMVSGLHAACACCLCICCALVAPGSLAFLTAHLSAPAPRSSSTPARRSRRVKATTPRGRKSFRSQIARSCTCACAYIHVHVHTCICTYAYTRHQEGASLSGHRLSALASGCALIKTGLRQRLPLIKCPCLIHLVACTNR